MMGRSATRLQPTLIRPTISQALRALAGMDGDRASERNGVGFNQIDGDLGHKLAAMPEQWMSPKQRYWAWLTLRKYKRQLSGLGVNYDAIEAPPTPSEELQARWEVDRAERAAARNTGRTVELVGESVLSWQFGAGAYDELVKNEMQLVLPVVWHKGSTSWRMRIDLDSIPKVRAFAAQNSFALSEAATLALATEEQSLARRVKASRASSAEFRVAGMLRELYPFQAAGVAYAVEAERCIIADEMGLGKTIQAIATVRHLEALPVLCVVPASVKINWQREWAATIAGVRVVVLDGEKADRTKLYDRYGERVADVVIVGYSTLYGWREVLGRYGFRAMIADEAHYLKSGKAQRTIAATEIATGLVQERGEDGKPKKRGRYKREGEGITVRLALTGTPVLSRSAELAAILKWLGRLDEVGGYWAVVTCSDHEALNRKLRARCYVRREKRDVLPELPPIQRSRVVLPIDNRREYSQAERDVIAYVYEAAARDADFLASIAHLSSDEQAHKTKQHQWSKAAAAERAAALARINALKTLASKGKLAAVKAWAMDFLETGEPLILFADRIETQKAIIAAFPDCASVTGDMQAEERTANVDRFQTDPDCKLIVCSLGAAREGLTMTRASNVAFAELGWTPGAHDQAEARCYGRMSDLHGANAWYLVGEETIDLDIEELIAEKRAVVDALTTGEAKADALGASVAGEVMRRMIAKGGE